MLVGALRANDEPRLGARLARERQGDVVITQWQVGIEARSLADESCAAQEFFFDDRKRGELNAGLFSAAVFELNFEDRLRAGLGLGERNSDLRRRRTAQD